LPFTGRASAITLLQTLRQGGTLQTSIEQIKKELLAAKIIKEDSKAPEAVLRQMYADAKIISTKSL
jgi:hypothetical protein